VKTALSHPVLKIISAKFCFDCCDHANYDFENKTRTRKSNLHV